MIESKGWDWKFVKGEYEERWKNPSIESYYLLNRWKSQGKKEFLDLGCGIGRHSILLGNGGFNVHCFDISDDALQRTKEWADEENLTFEYKVGDMLDLPYDDESMDCILCRNVISHSDTEGVKKIISHIYRVLKNDGECYLTLCSKETWGFRQDWPIVDENTRLKMDEGPEYKVPHFYADYDLILKLFEKFEIVDLRQIVTYNLTKNYESYHYHVLIKKK